ncbi:unnamed protein product [Camellia sinensis]
MWPYRRDCGSMFACIVLLFVSFNTCHSIGGDTLSAGQNLLVNRTLASQGNIFELGFFTKGTSFNTYLGIWYKNFTDKIIVWVANRDKPLSNPSSSKLEFSEDGNLLLLEDSSKTPIWSTNFMSPIANSTEAVLLDDGNFVLRNSSEPSTVFWQSFDHPTDTWLPGAKLRVDKLTGKTQSLVSWRNSEDPAPGVFSLGIDINPNKTTQFYIEWNMSVRYWSSGAWDGEKFNLAPEMGSNNIFNFSFVSDESESYFTYSLKNSAMLSRFVMEQSGQISQLAWLDGVWDWKILPTQPSKLSEVYAYCGAFGIFNEYSSTHCTCLQGFKPLSTEATLLDDWSGGCVRKIPLQLESNVTRKNDVFLKISDVKFPASSKEYIGPSSQWCELGCLQNCSCTAYAYNAGTCSILEGALLNLQISDGNTANQDFYLKLAASELSPAGGKRRKLWVIIAAFISPTLLISIFLLCYLLKRKLKQNGAKHLSEDLVLYDFDGSSNATDNESNTGYNLTRGKKDAELPFFSFTSVSAATASFSPENKLGEGGFGPVYKGKLHKGQEIALKRLSKRSGQGHEEFRNEIELIAKLQHRNLVRLLGCCIEHDENILIYEYMPNKSLDFFIFDPNKREMLDWGTRIHIIEGIAQGLLYLHQYSRLRIIHRDLKASNILLDSEMNPKISDFGIARIFGGNESQANTKRIVGTYGYMSPEYAMEGLFSIKSDVFSFGVLMLEILFGKRNSGFYQCDSLNLLGHAWHLWNDGQVSELLDVVLDYACNSTVLRYINIGLLCVQEKPTDRPTMSGIVSMLSNEVAPLPTPKQPAFSTSRAAKDTDSSPRMTGTCSVNSVTITVIEAR